MQGQLARCCMAQAARSAGSPPSDNSRLHCCRMWPWRRHQKSVLWPLPLLLWPAMSPCHLKSAWRQRKWCCWPSATLTRHVSLVVAAVSTCKLPACIPAAILPARCRNNRDFPAQFTAELLLRCCVGFERPLLLLCLRMGLGTALWSLLAHHAGLLLQGAYCGGQVVLRSLVTWPHDDRALRLLCGCVSSEKMLSLLPDPSKCPCAPWA